MADMCLLCKKKIGILDKSGAKTYPSGAVCGSCVKQINKALDVYYQSLDGYTLTQLEIVYSHISELLVHRTELEKINSKTLRDTISALLQRGRHAKIHLVLAAQNPIAQQMKVEIGNASTRIAFHCNRKNHSEIILGEPGAEKLVGKGELLLKNSQFDGTQHLQGVYATPDELHQIICQIRQWHSGADKAGAKFTIPPEIFQASVAGDSSGADALTVPVKAKPSADDHTFASVLLWVLGQTTISVNALMDQFHLGWSKANRLVKRLEELGVVGEPLAKLPRCVVPTEVGDLPAEMLEFLEYNGVDGNTLCQIFATRVEK